MLSPRHPVRVRLRVHHEKNANFFRKPLTVAPGGTHTRGTESGPGLGKGGAGAASALSLSVLLSRGNLVIAGASDRCCSSVCSRQGLNETDPQLVCPGTSLRLLEAVSPASLVYRDRNGP